MAGEIRRAVGEEHSEGVCLWIGRIQIQTV